MSGDDYIDVSVVFYRATADAVLIAPATDTGNKQWLPRSTLHAISDKLIDQTERGAEIELTMREWIARKKELI